jgi:polyphosphate kinase
MTEPQFFNRDISWLLFNERVLEEAARDTVPLLERIKFLGIFSSNLDEFYRVRMPVLKALKYINEPIDPNFDEHTALLQRANQLIYQQQVSYGQILVTQILPQLKENNIRLIYNDPIPKQLHHRVSEYFLNTVLAYLQPVALDDEVVFFPENNKLYLFIQLVDDTGEEKFTVMNIPSDVLPRFLHTEIEGTAYVCFLDDIIRFNIDKLLGPAKITGCYSFKITRDAELDLKDEYSGDLSDQLEQQLKTRDLGLATRLLFEHGMPLRILEMIRVQFNLRYAAAVEGGRYHNLKDFMSFPVELPELLYQAWPAVKAAGDDNSESLSAIIADKDMIVHTPYQSYQTILRFFNEAANDADVEEIYVTLYRVASDSKIVNALISAAKNGKKVQVVVELKARFDEANNLKWAKKMKDAGVKIIYSITALKVHAKVALVKSRKQNRVVYTGLLATGNLNEGTARFYTDHVLLTSDNRLLREMELLFIFLNKREKPSDETNIDFKHLLVAGFNLQDRFMELIDREISFAKEGLEASIQIKLNNLEEKVLISKLYEASQAGVKISLIIRGICCLIPGVAGMSENITVKRIVDRYLEHGRVFVFNNQGDKEVFLGSADWMNRNIYHRIEVCFPIYQQDIKDELLHILDLQLKDNVQAVWLDSSLANIPVKKEKPHISSQHEIYQLLKDKN